MFYSEFCEISKNTFFTEHVWVTASLELFFSSNVNYNLRSGSQFHQPSANTVWKRQKTILYLVPKIWNMVPGIMKQKSSLFFLKKLSNGSPKPVHIGYVKAT